MTVRDEGRKPRRVRGRASSGSDDPLRRQAEEQLEKLDGDECDGILPEDVPRLLHELRVHQIELEAQNEELRRAHLELKDLEDKYFDLYESAPVGYLTIGKHGLIDEANLRACQLLGIDRREIIRWPLPKFVSAYDQDGYYLHLRQAQNTLCRQNCEVRLTRVDGTVFWAQFETMPVRDDRGEFAGYRTVFSDISERRRAEEEALVQRAKLAKVFDNAPYVMMLVNKDGRVTDINRAGSAFAGTPREELLDLLGGEVIHCINSYDGLGCGKNPVCTDCPVRTNVMRTFRTGESVRNAEGRMTVRTESGDIPLVLLIATVLVKGVETEEVLVTIADITERKRAEEHIRLLTHQSLTSQETERLKLSRDLHDSVGQELAALKIGIDTLLDDLPGEVNSIMGGKVAKLSRMLQETISEVRNIAHDLRPSTLEQLGLVRTLQQYCEDFSERTGTRVNVLCAGMDDLDVGFETRITIFRLVQEGLNNVQKHAEANEVSLKLVASSPKIILILEDDGKGFDVQERMKSILEEKRMGLCYMEERVALLRGSIKIDSRPLQGTRIRIELPMKEKSQENHPDRPVG